MLAIAYGASIGSILTPITGIANVIGRGTIERMTGYQVELFDWVSLSAPYLLVMGAVMWAALVLVNRPEVKRIRGGQDYFRAHYADLGAMTRGERNVLVIFLITSTLWVGVTAQNVRHREWRDHRGHRPPQRGCGGGPRGRDAVLPAPRRRQRQLDPHLAGGHPN